MAAERIVICGGGIAGVAMAYELAVLRGVRNVVLLESREAPLTLTSAYSTECYRNLWSDAHMMELMNLSIDRVETMAEEAALDNMRNGGGEGKDGGAGKKEGMGNTVDDGDSDGEVAGLVDA